MGAVMGLVPPSLLFRRKDNRLKEDHPATYQETNAGMQEPVKRLPVSEYTDEPYESELLTWWPPQGGSGLCLLPPEFRVDHRLIGEEYR